MTPMIVAAFAGALLAPVHAAPPAERPMTLALNPQPEPPGKAKIKRIYSGKDDDRRQLKKIKQKPNTVAPATRY